MLFCYIPYSLESVPSLASPTDYPRVTSDLEVPITYVPVVLTCGNTSQAECVYAVTADTYLPPGSYTFVVHVLPPLHLAGTGASVYYSGVPAVVTDAALLGSGNSSAALCGLLGGSSTEDAFTQAATTATVTRALVDSYGPGGLTADSSELRCADLVPSNGSTTASWNDTGGNSGSIADRLLEVLVNATRAMSTDNSPLAINVVNSVSTAVNSIAQAVTADSRPPCSSWTVLAVLSVTTALTSYLSNASVGYQSGNDSVLDVFNLGFENVAAVYGQLLTANTSDPSMHCTVVSAMEQRFSSLLNAALGGHATGQPDVQFSGESYSAASSRVAAATNVTLSQLNLTIPAAAVTASTTTYVDVQRILLKHSQAQWSRCFSAHFDLSFNGNSTAGEATDVSLVADSALYLIQLVDPATGAEYSVYGLSTPIQFALPYALDNSTAGGYTASCAFYNRSSSSWSSTGCTSLLDTAGVLCACSHLTEFTLVLQPVSASAGSAQTQLSAAQAFVQADLAGVLVVYLVPLALASLLLLLAAVLHRRMASAVPWSRTVYALIVLVSLMRCVCASLLYFDNRNQATHTFDQNPLAEATTALLLLPLLLEVVLLAVLFYRYAVVRRREGASRMVNGKLDLRRVSVVPWRPVSLVPRLSASIMPEGKGQLRRLSVTQRLSVALSSSDKAIVAPPNHIVPLVFALVYLAAAIATLASYFGLGSHSGGGSSSTYSAVSSLLGVTFVAAFTIAAVWLVFLYYSVPNLVAVMRRGQALGWLTVGAFFLQSLLVLCFAEPRSAGWYFEESAGGVHVMLAVYSVVEAMSLCGMALWWRWTLKWWRTNQLKHILARYESAEASVMAQASLKGDDGFEMNFATPVPSEKADDCIKSDPALPFKQRQSGTRPSTAGSLMSAGSEADVGYEADDPQDESPVDIAAVDTTQTESKLGDSGGALSDKGSCAAEEHAQHREKQLFVSEERVRFSFSSASRVAPCPAPLLTLSTPLQTDRPTTVRSTDHSSDNTPQQLSDAHGPMLTPLQLSSRQHRLPSILALPSPLLIADGHSRSSSSSDSPLPSAVTTPLLQPVSASQLFRRHSSIIAWELAPPAGPLGAADESAITMHGLATPAASLLEPFSALSLLSAGPVLTPVPNRILPAEDEFHHVPAAADNDASIAAASSVHRPSELATDDDVGLVQSIHVPAALVSPVPWVRTVAASFARATDEQLLPSAVPSSPTGADGKQHELQQPQNKGALGLSLVGRTSQFEREEVERLDQRNSLLRTPPAAALIHSSHVDSNIRHIEPDTLTALRFNPAGPISAASSSTSASPTLSPLLRPMPPNDVLVLPLGRLRSNSVASGGRSSVSLLPSAGHQLHQSPSLTATAAATVTLAQKRRSSVSDVPDTQHGVRVASNSASQQRAQRLHQQAVQLSGMKAEAAAESSDARTAGWCEDERQSPSLFERALHPGSSPDSASPLRTASVEPSVPVDVLVLPLGRLRSNSVASEGRSSVSLLPSAGHQLHQSPSLTATAAATVTLAQKRRSSVSDVPDTQHGVRVASNSASQQRAQRLHQQAVQLSVSEASAVASESVHHSLPASLPAFNRLTDLAGHGPQPWSHESTAASLAFLSPSDESNGALQTRSQPRDAWDGPDEGEGLFELVQRPAVSRAVPPPLAASEAHRPDDEAQVELMPDSHGRNILSMAGRKSIHSAMRYK